MSFEYLNVFKSIKHTEDYHIRKPNHENCLFEIGDKNIIFVREKLINLETTDIIVKCFLNLGFEDIKFPYA